MWIQSPNFAPGPKLTTTTLPLKSLTFRLGDIHEKLGNHAKAHEWFSLLAAALGAQKRSLALS